ncbi:MAG TPA: hypothetical protein VFJ93_13640 [Gaiellaceae bacterium]|nr:hypothetical protein [Gaiellaceae bacterium]
MRRRHLPLVLVAALALAVPGHALPGPNVTTMQLGSKFTVTGRTGSAEGKHVRAVGKVVVSARWGSDRWHVISTTMTDGAGNYRFTITPRRRGNLTLRVLTPDHHPRRFLLRVY